MHSVNVEQRVDKKSVYKLTKLDGEIAVSAAAKYLRGFGTDPKDKDGNLIKDSDTYFAADTRQLNSGIVQFDREAIVGEFEIRTLPGFREPSKIFSYHVVDALHCSRVVLKTYSGGAVIFDRPLEAVGSEKPFAVYASNLGPKFAFKLQQELGVVVANVAIRFAEAETSLRKILDAKKAQELVEESERPYREFLTTVTERRARQLDDVLSDTPNLALEYFERDTKG